MARTPTGNGREPETPEQWADRTRREQALPPKITDPVVLRRVAVLIAGGRRALAADVD